MQTHTVKNSNLSVDDQSGKKSGEGANTLKFVDNRSAAAVQRNLQKAADESPQSGNIAQFQHMAESILSQQNPPIQKKENRTGLPDNLKSGIENMSGYSMDDVKVHYNSDKPAQLQAHAYAQGTDIHLASGQEKHLPHEAWHVVQQKQGRVNPTLQMKGVSVNDNDSLEQEADQMGAKILQSKGDNQVVENLGSSSGTTVQRVVVQSDWMKKGDSSMELATTSAGPWNKCTDKTSAGYRDSAEEQLGSLRGLDVLSKYGVIPEATMKGRGPFARAHLIAASFGGQKKFTTPQDNIRYHPLDVEYGDWQLSENAVEAADGRGFLTARSSEMGAGTAFLMALDIGKIVENEHGFLAGHYVTQAFEPLLAAAAYVPTAVGFTYVNIDEPGNNITKQWNGLESTLDVKPVGAARVFAAMKELGLKLPPGIDFDDKGSDVQVNNRDKLLELIGGIGIAKGALGNLNKKINNLKTLVAEGKITVENATDALNKHPYLQKKPGRWILGGTFSTWADL